MRFARGLIAATIVFGMAAAPAASRSANEPDGFRSSGTLVVRANVAGAPLDVGGDVALYRRGSRYRLDLLTLAFPSTGSTASAALGALLPSGGATLIYDGSTGLVSAYSNATHRYYRGDPKGVSAQPGSASRAPAAAGAADPLEALAAMVRQLHDVQRASVQLTGHSTVNGHPADDIDVLLRRQRPGKPLEDYHAQLELADDLDGFPVRILLSSTPPTPQDFGGSLRLDLTTIARDDPDEGIFALPQGYTRVSTLGDVLRPQY